MKQLEQYGLFFMLTRAERISTTAKNKSIKGKEFWRSYSHNTFIEDSPFYRQAHVLYLCGEKLSTVTVSLTGSCKTDITTQQIIVLEKPTAHFGFDCNICIEDSIRFLDSSRIMQGSIVSWQWSFGDGSSVTKLIRITGK